MRPVAEAAGVRAMEILGIVEAAKDAQGRLRLVGLSIDEREMPREGDPLNRVVDVARVGDKRPSLSPWRTVLHVSIKCREKRTHCGSRHRNVPRWMTWSFASMRECAWTSQ